MRRLTDAIHHPSSEAVLTEVVDLSRHQRIESLVFRISGLASIVRPSMTQ